MKIRVGETAFRLFLVTVFLFAFEQAYVILFGFDSFFKPYRLALFAAIGVMLLRWPPMARPIQQLTLAFLGIYALGILLAMIRGVFIPNDLGATWHQTQLFVIAFSFFIIAVSTIKNPAQIQKVLTVVLVSTAVSSIIWYLFANNSELFRVSGMFRNPNHFAYLLALSLLIALYLITRNVARPLTVVALLVWLFAGVLLLTLTGSRGGVSTVLPAMILFFYRYFSLRGRGRSTRGIVGLGLVVAFAVFVPYLIESDLLNARLLNRFTAEQIETGSGRQDLWRAGMLAAEDAWYTGIGMAQYVGVHSYYIRQVSGDVYSTVLEYDLGLHSEYVNLLVEFGFIGLIAYLIAVFWIWRGILAFGRTHPQWKHLSGFLESLLVLDLLFSATQDMYFFPYHWLVLGLCASLIGMRYSHEKARA